MKNRFLAAAMAAVMALSVTACSGGSSAPETKAPESAEASKAEETSKAETEKETKAEEEKTEAAEKTGRAHYIKYCIYAKLWKPLVCGGSTGSGIHGRRRN